MDQQGTPIGNTATGTKNTSTPADPIQEGPGAIAKDSLAAESSAIPDQYTQDVSGSASTFNNTDTSGATTLPPARSGGDRLASDEGDSAPGNAGQKYPEALGGAKFTGTHSEEGYRGGSRSESTGTGGSGVYKTGLGSDSSAEPRNTDSAPTYAQVPLQEDKPKGRNIQEGGFDADAPNASFTTEIGTDKDPGRLAEQQFQKGAMSGAMNSGMPKTQSNVDNEQPYGSLDTEQSA